MRKTGLALAFVLISLTATMQASPTQGRLDTDVKAGNPIAIHVSVALADNEHQWIAPVPESIGNGQDARTNLYWGARYGIKTYMMRDAGWARVGSRKPGDKRILERLILRKTFARGGRPVTVYLVADAWDGRYIRDTIDQFLRYSGGHDELNLAVGNKRLAAGGAAHLVAYIGHNALMDYGGVASLRAYPSPKTHSPNDAVVLACKSKSYFASHLNKLGAHPLVLTTGLMAPEAYSLDAAIGQWIAGAGDQAVRRAAAAAYSRYQKTGTRAAEHLFDVGRGGEAK